MIVTCDNTACGKAFKLRPDSLIEAISVDENDDEIEWMEREYVFICPECDKRYAVTDCAEDVDSV